MPLVVAGTGTGATLEPACTPHEINVGVINSGSGGTFYITQGDPLPVGNVDPEVMFSPAFNATPWIAFFKKTFATSAEAAKVFFKLYSIHWYPILGCQASPPDVTFDLNGGKPMLVFDSPAQVDEESASWRLEIRMRNTLTR